MKRLCTFLSLFLLTLVAGVTCVNAQSYRVGGAPKKSMSEVVGKKVVLWAPRGGYFAAGYWDNTSTINVDGITDQSIFIFEAVEGKTVVGTVSGETYQVYRMKQFDSGLYVKDVNLDEEGNGQEVKYTENAAEAYEFTCERSEQAFLDENDNYVDSAPKEPRTLATDKRGNQDLTAPSFIICRAATSTNFEDSFDGFSYLGSWGKVVFSPYPDTNAWVIFDVEEINGYEKLENFMLTYCGAGAPNDLYVVGNNPGEYKAEYVAEAQACYETIDAAVQDMSLTNEEIDALCERTKKAYTALETEDAIVPIVSAYYFIHDSRYNSYWLQAKNKDGEDYIGCKNGYEVTDSLTTDAVDLIWKVDVTEDEDGNKLATFQSVSTRKYFNDKENVGDRNWFSMGDEPVQFKVAYTGTATPKGWNIETEGGNLLATNQSGGCLHWNVKFDPGTNFAFITVSESDFANLIEEARQKRINLELNNLYNTVTAAYNAENSSYISNALGDALFDHEGKLVNDAEQFFSNHKEGSEGSYEDLLDDDFTTFFHSNWSSSYDAYDPNDPHFLAISLNEPVEAGAYQIKIAKRIYASLEKAIDYPTTVNVYVANKVNTEYCTGDWTSVGVVNVDWCDSLEIGGRVFQNAIGYINFKVDEAFKYVRFDVIQTDLKRGFFALGSCNMWKAEFVGESDAMKEVSAETKAKLVAELDAAKKELNDKKATREQIESLQAAYDQFLKELSEPSRVTEVVTEAKNFLNNAVQNELVGDRLAQYSEEAAQALQAVITEGEAFESAEFDEISAMIQKVSQALADFKASVNIPEAGSFYILRSATTKWRIGDNGWGYKSQLYSLNNGTGAGNIRMTRAEGSDNEEYQSADFDITTAELNDTVSYSDNLKYLWKIEKAEAGKVVVRNVGTGMYMAPQFDGVRQSTEPVEIQLVGAKTDVFLLEAGKNANNQMCYVNARVADNNIVSWTDITDKNNYFTFEYIPSDLIDQNATRVSIGGGLGSMQIVTLPYDIDGTDIRGGVAYKLVGLDYDLQPTLSRIDDVIPAGTPFILKVDDEYNPDMANWRATAGINDIALDGVVDGTINYDFTPKSVNGIKGTICENDTVMEGYATLNAQGKVVATSKSGTVIGANSGYLDLDAFDGVIRLDNLKYEINADDHTATVVGYTNGSGNSLIIPSSIGHEGEEYSVASINNTAFRDCKTLYEVTLPETLVSIGSEAFTGCVNLDKINSLNPVPPTISGSSAFEGVNKETCKVIVPQDCKEAYQDARYWNDFLNIIGYQEEQILIQLQNSVDLAQSLYDNSVEGTQKGQYAIGSRAALQAVINDVIYKMTDAFDEELFTQYINDMQAAIDEFNGHLLLEDADADITQYDNTIYINKMQALVGSTTTLSINLKNAMDVAGFQFDLYLPEGMSFALNEDGELDAKLSEERTNSTKTDFFNFAIQEDGSLRVLAASTKLNTFTGNDGEIVQIKVNVGENMAVGDYPLILQGIVMSGVTEDEVVDVDFMKSTITVSMPEPGDVNADGVVSVVDFIATSRYILGKDPKPFVYSAADINKDERINVADLIGISRIVLADNADETAKAPARAYTYAAGNISVDSFCMEAGNTVLAPVCLNTNVPVMGFQFDVELLEGVTLKSVSLDDSRGLAAHTDFLDFARLENGCYRVLCASTTNTAFAGNNGPALHLAIESKNGLELGDYSMAISNIVLASSNECMYPDGFAVPFHIGSATHIDLIGVDAHAVVDVYDVKGVMVRSKVKAAKCLEGLPVGIYIVNGKRLLNRTDNLRNK